MRFTNQFVSYAFDWLFLLHGPIRDFVYKLACEFQYELTNFATNFATSEHLWSKFREIDCKIVPGVGIFHSQLAQGPCISLQVVSRHPGIYTIIRNQIKCPGVFPGGGWLLLELTHVLPMQESCSRLELVFLI